MKKDKVQTVTNDELPFLYMKTSWYLKGDLQFGFFEKKGKQLKYAGKVSTHRTVTICVILSVFPNCLAKLTSHKPSFHYKRVESVYPDHANSLRKAGLAPSVFPKMGE